MLFRKKKHKTYLYYFQAITFFFVNSLALEYLGKTTLFHNNSNIKIKKKMKLLLLLLLFSSFINAQVFEITLTK